MGSIDARHVQSQPPLLIKFLLSSRAIYAFLFTWNRINYAIHCSTQEQQSAQISKLDTLCHREAVHKLKVNFLITYPNSI